MNKLLHAFSNKKSFEPEEIRRDCSSRVTVDYCLRSTAEFREKMPAEIRWHFPFSCGRAERPSPLGVIYFRPFYVVVVVVSTIDCKFVDIILLQAESFYSTFCGKHPFDIAWSSSLTIVFFYLVNVNPSYDDVVFIIVSCLKCHHVKVLPCSALVSRQDVRRPEEVNLFRPGMLHFRVFRGSPAFSGKFPRRHLKSTRPSNATKFSLCTTR